MKKKLLSKVEKIIAKSARKASEVESGCGQSAGQSGSDRGYCQSCCA